jgi:uncharacterized protein (TIGR03435 family)
LVNAKRRMMSWLSIAPTENRWRTDMRLLMFVCLVSGLAAAQDFEVASVRRAGPESTHRFCDGGPGTSDPGQIVCGRLRFRELIIWAYNVDDAQIEGPSWIGANSDLYDVRAKVPVGSTVEQAQKMAQNLLAERFHLEVHHETRQFPVWELVIARGGPKFKESTGEFAQKPDYPPLGPSGVGFRGTGRAEFRMAAHGVALERFLQSLRGFAGRPIINKTGLGGKYDLWLEFDGRAMMFPDYVADAPALNVAMEQQLGLKLVDAKKAYDVVVIDHADKEPAEN